MTDWETSGGYRLYFFDNERRIRSRKDFYAVNDEQAAVQATQILAERGLYAAAELWQGRRLIRCFPD